MEYKILDLLNDVLSEDAQIAEEKRIADVATQTSARTDEFNSQYKELQSRFDAQRAKIESKVRQNLEKDPDYTGSRSAGVGLALKSEIADVSMGGTGSGHWNKAECQTLLLTGKLPDHQGHHINSVADHPNEQGNPDNITFVTPNDHLRLHHGNFRNPTEGRTIDRNRMLRNTNKKRVVRNEVKGFVSSTVPDMYFDFFMNFVPDLFDKNIPAKETLLRCGKSALKTGGKKAACYLISRLFQSR